MRIETKYSGTVEINEEHVTRFPAGIPSFEEEKEFILLPFGEGPSPFYILQSIQTAGLAFIVMEPFATFPDYEVALSDQTLEMLEIEAETDVSLFVILTLKDSFETSTANLRGPVVINHVKHLGRQVALQQYETRTPIPVTAKEER
ncbi:flagellar assembly protein FliW [Alkalicoccus urumqiensis]|uniref:Flagellar assembly factor FliW n=1 Tax=Alkalicoccus urumqiensis TaxID=1548213 RepID=A0A2P6MHC0_ALKUR|nr:flagellar assembly protein FliW [Alkalicoccus urumqiensis]PRO65661.1 flagellar assembly protein FliW [Alkalicoccus urumqiensis]